MNLIVFIVCSEDFERNVFVRKGVSCIAYESIYFSWTRSVRDKFTAAVKVIFIQITIFMPHKYVDAQPYHKANVVKSRENLCAL